MKIILLSGGSGKRLWPLSNEVRSKQFLKVVQDKDGRNESMVQRVYRQITAAGLGANITVATSAAQVEAIQNQLGDKVSIVVEPSRRNTFPAIVLSAAYLRFKKGCSLNETIIVLPVDPYVDDEYFQTLKELDKIVQSEVAEIALMGVKPTYPSEKYGYIIPDGNSDEISMVREFREKPDLKSARELIAKGGLWNCGVFAFRLSYLMNFLEGKMSCHFYEDILAQWQNLEQTSFDYAILEKAESVAVIPYHGEWKDLGTWNMLTEVMGGQVIGNVRISEDCSNTHVVNELEIPIVVIGTRNMVVAASPDGILVADKEQSSYIKKYVDGIDMRPMFEERAWGDYTVLNVSVDSAGNRAVTKKKSITAGSIIEEAFHPEHSEVWTILSGRAVLTINSRSHDALPGDTYTIPENVSHSLMAVEDTVILEVQISR